MIYRLNELSPWVTATLFVALVEFFTLGLMLLSRKRWGIDRLRLNNEVAGFKFAVVGVLYAVLLAFVVVAIWEDYSRTEAAVRDEAKALLDLDRVSHAFPDPAGSEIRSSIRNYLRAVRESEWKTMANGVSSPDAEAGLMRLSQAIFVSKPNAVGDVVIFDHALKLFTTVDSNRTERLDAADGSVPGVLWLVIVAGALITLGYPAFFASSNLGAQVLMTALLGALVALTLFVATMLSYPFTGSVHVSREPFDRALRHLS